MSADPELRRLYLDSWKASEALVLRIESLEELVPARPSEAAIADEGAQFALFVERQFRGWYERTRDVREALEDPSLRPPAVDDDMDPRD